MTTITHSAKPCHKDILTTINAGGGAVSARDIRARLSSPYRLRDITDALENLAVDGLVDFEQRRSEIKLYFLTSKPPRGHVRIVPAGEQLPLQALNKSSWCSQLGGGV